MIKGNFWHYLFVPQGSSLTECALLTKARTRLAPTLALVLAIALVQLQV